jgi:hypothetical protein
MKRQIVRLVLWTSVFIGLAGINAIASGGPMPDPSGGGGTLQTQQ